MTRNHKRSNVDTGNVVDILVTLPRELIHTILDWAPVRDVARTSILSTKWRYIWSEHPRVILDKPFFEENFKNKRAPVDSYVYAIYSIILHHNGPVQKFHLYIPNGPSDMNQHVFQWLVYLSKNGINDFILDNRHTSPCALPSHVLSHPELKYARLSNCIVKVPKGFGGFSQLTYLRLDRLSFTPEILGNVVAPAPALKNLTFNRCTGIQHFKIHSPKLDFFTILRSCDVQLTNYENVPDLTALRICLGNTVPDQKHRLPVNLIHFLQRSPKLEKLQLDGFFLKLFAAATIPEQISTTFDQLTYLNLMDLNFNYVDEMLCLPGLLKSCPNIEELNIWASDVRDGTREQSAAIDSVTWTLSELTTVSISSINGLTTELGFIEMLHASAPILEQMSINYRETMDAIQKFDISNKLLDFTRASTEARIKYVEKPQEKVFPNFIIYGSKVKSKRSHMGSACSWEAILSLGAQKGNLQWQEAALKLNTAAELKWIGYLLRDLHFKLPQCPVLLCDNKSALDLIRNPVFHARTKHIEIDYQFTREQVASKVLSISHIPSKE